MFRSLLCMTLTLMPDLYSLFTCEARMISTPLLE